MTFTFLAVDLQNDFTSEGGPHFKDRPSIAFLRSTFFPFLQEKEVMVSEIISDYRQPRPGDRDESCIPGTWGYESVVPTELVKQPQWVKCMNSPLWKRDGIGDPAAAPGLPYQDTEAFGMWLKEHIGEPGESTPLLFGLTIDCCVLSTVRELAWRGYRPAVLYEGVDHYSGSREDKDAVITTAARNWATIVPWADIEKELT